MPNPNPCLDVTTDCTPCAVAPKTYKVTLSGITNGSCAGCTGATGWNRTYTMNYSATSCIWEETAALGCNVGKEHVVVVTGVTMIFRLRFASAMPGFIRLEYSGSIENCLKKNTLPLTTNGGDCQTVPSNVDVYPV